MDLPNGPLWTILNHLPFVDMVKLCSISRCTHRLSQSSDYFQHRLAVYGLNTSEYQCFLISHRPKDAYVATLVKTRRVEVDLTVLVYLSDSKDFLTPGLEYYIGLSKMGVRAINNDDQENLLYTLSLHPNIFELKRILGTLFVRHLDGQNSFLPHALLEKLLKVYQEKLDYVTLRDEYYPGSAQEYNFYESGRNGSERFLTSESVSNVGAYIYGVIDGRHSLIFPMAFWDYEENKDSVYDLDDIIYYVARKGTAEMMKLIYETKILRSMGSIAIYSSASLIDVVIKSNNVEATAYLLPFYLEDKDEPGHTLLPRSSEMINLLRSKGIEISTNNIFVGAFFSGNYRLLMGKNETIDPDLIDENSNLHCLSPYLLGKYFTTYDDVDDPHLTDRYIIRRLIEIDDVYRIETLFSHGYVPSYLENDEIPKMMERLTLGSMVEMSQYPNLQKYLTEDSETS